jgi:OOP family OmpA-OmpF porin
MRPDIELPEPEPTEPALTPFRAIVAFPEGGTKLTGETKAVLDRIMKTEQMELGGPITLRSHTDSAGGDETNLDVSEERGLAVAEWLIERGVNPDRITVIPLGEQNPIQPNANPDGSPFARGRAANRRVEVEIGVEPETAEPAAPPEAGED